MRTASTPSGISTEARSTTSTPASSGKISAGETKAEIERQFGPGHEPGHGGGCAYQTRSGIVIVEYGITGPDGGDAFCSVPSDARAKTVYP